MTLRWLDTTTSTRRRTSTAQIALLCALLSACASPALREADSLAVSGRHELALAVLDAARQKDPADNALRAAQQRQRELTIATLASQADAARVAGRLDVAGVLLARLEALDPSHLRVHSLRSELGRAERHRQALAAASRALDTGRIAEATAKLREVASESPGLPAARALQRRIAEMTPEPPPPDAMGSAFQKRLTLEFREASLRSVFESVGRTSGVNFVFDKDVRADAKISVLLRDVTLDEAMRVILSTQQLDRKLLNDSSMLIYPNTPAKQQEHQELVTRSFYLANADAKQAQLLIKTMAKTRDVYIDERLNLLIVRDTPEIIRLSERLIASIDLPEPEVMLEVEVMEIGTNRLNELGLQWPETIEYGVPDFVGSITRADRSSFRASIANPALIATLRGNSGTTNLIANPKLRARNREKAKVQIGERLPVFTTSTIANAGVATSVSYVDTGLKLEVEPSVQLDNDVIMKVSLEVSNLIGQVTGPQGAIAYRVGTRNATTSLRLRDGETQILAGLINDEDRKAVQGVPGVSELPVVGRLFGVHSDTRNKSEVVLLITPRVVRNLGLPDAATIAGPGGSYANPGATGMRLRPAAKIALPMSTAPGASAAARPAGDGAAAPQPGVAILEITTSGQATVGETVSVTLQSRSNVALQGQIQFDAELLQFAGAAEGDPLAFALEPMGQKVFVLRARPGSAGKSTQVRVEGLGTGAAAGAALAVRVEGDGNVTFVAR
ncbi:MAG: secretin N-terminal domain-containing protein [Burkholderiaceae bacterium]